MTGNSIHKAGGGRDTAAEGEIDLDPGLLLRSRNIERWIRKFLDKVRAKQALDRGLREGPRKDDYPWRVCDHVRRGISGEQREVRKDQTYAPASLRNKPKLLRAYARLHNEIGGARPWTRPMLEIAAVLDCSERAARQVVSELEAAGVLEVERRPGQESQYRLLQERTYVEFPVMLVARQSG
jgi:hypothetical protein